MSVSRLYSYALVSAQIGCIAFLVQQTYPFFHLLPLSISLFGFVFGIFTLITNQPGNFNIVPEIKANASLVTTGAYRYIRHPMYLSVLIMMLGCVIAHTSWSIALTYVGLGMTLFLKARKEERLWGTLTPQYLAYKQRTKYIIPFIL